MIETLHWDEARKYVLDARPDFAKEIDLVCPSDDLKIYKISYPFGATILDGGVLYVPLHKGGGVVPIYDKRVNKTVRNDLFSAKTIPVGLLLNHSLELYQIICNRVIPYSIMKTGKIFGLSVMKRDSTDEYVRRIWNMTAGVRSVYVLPKISILRSFERVSTMYSLSCKVPNSLSEQWPFIYELTNKDNFPEAWKVDILFFSESWLRRLRNGSWPSLKLYFYDQYYNDNTSTRIRSVFEPIFTNALAQCNLKPNPYIIQTVKHLYEIMFGNFPAYKFASDSTSLPLQGLQQVLNDVYRINYAPSILNLDYFNRNESDSSFYYSLGFPTGANEMPKTIHDRGKLFDLQEIRNVVGRTWEKMRQHDSDTKIIQEIDRSVQLDYFHKNKAKGLQPTDKIATFEPVVRKETKQFDRPFCTTSPFIRGCIRISTK